MRDPNHNVTRSSSSGFSRTHTSSGFIFTSYFQLLPQTDNTASLDPQVLRLRVISFSNSIFKWPCAFKNLISNSLAKISDLVLFQDFKPDLSGCLRETPVPPTSTRLLSFCQWHITLKMHQVRKNVFPLLYSLTSSRLLRLFFTMSLSVYCYLYSPLSIEKFTQTVIFLLVFSFYP